MCCQYSLHIYHKYIRNMLDSTTALPCYTRSILEKYMFDTVQLCFAIITAHVPQKQPHHTQPPHNTPPQPPPSTLDPTTTLPYYTTIIPEKIRFATLYLGVAQITLHTSQMYQKCISTHQAYTKRYNRPGPCLTRS